MVGFLATRTWQRASLLGLGSAMLFGGTRHERQTFDRANIGLLSTWLILVVAALLLPAMFDLNRPP